MITIDMNKAKEIGHNIRRQMRAAEFAPLDEEIAKRIPGTDIEAIESQRQAIRYKYAEAQDRINISATPDEIKAALQL